MHLTNSTSSTMGSKMSTCDCYKYHYKSCKCAENEKQALIFWAVLVVVVIALYCTYRHFNRPDVPVTPEPDKPPRVEQVIRYRT